jgi:UDP-glucose 4-epimerase
VHGKTIFITGGAGFIGSTLAGRLAHANRVVLYDNLRRNALASTGLAAHPNVRMVTGDVLDPDGLEAAMSGATHVVHCAAIAGIDTVSKSPVTTMEVNMVGSANVLRTASLLDDVERVVCFSTSETYGSHAFRVTERDEARVGPPGEPRWTYAVSKLAEEHLALAYHTEQQLPAVVLRPFNVYGPGQVGEGALSIFVQRALRDEPLVVRGDGTQIRAWCYVDDMVDAVLRSLARPEAVGRSFNIGNPRAVTTILGLAEAVVRLVGSSSPIEFQPAPGADVHLRVPDIADARALLEFEPRVDLEAGVRRTADFHRVTGARP